MPQQNFFSVRKTTINVSLEQYEKSLSQRLLDGSASDMDLSSVSCLGKRQLSAFGPV